MVSALVEMYVQGVSTRKGEGNYRGAVRAWLRRIATISAINKRLDEGLSKVAQRRLSEDYPYLILDARYEKVRDDGIIQSQAVLIAIGI